MKRKGIVYCNCSFQQNIDENLPNYKKIVNTLRCFKILLTLKANVLQHSSNLTMRNVNQCTSVNLFLHATDAKLTIQLDSFSNDYKKGRGAVKIN